MSAAEQGKSRAWETNRQTCLKIGLVVFVVFAIAGVIYLKKYRGFTEWPLQTAEASELVERLQDGCPSVDSAEIVYKGLMAEAEHSFIAIKLYVDSSWSEAEEATAREIAAEVLSDQGFLDSFRNSYYNRYGVNLGEDVGVSIEIVDSSDGTVKELELDI